MNESASRGYRVAVVGATGAVGREMLATIQQLNLPTTEVRALASARSAGGSLPFAGRPIAVEELTHDSFAEVDIALFSAGGSVSREFGPTAAKAGAIVIDNSSAFRMEEDVPLVV
ncbi:MAG: aspartate-semialdehyde dehydrogenase, partial [Myxococcota bacterium]